MRRAFRDAALFFRGLIFIGRRYRCPCCNWPLRAFTARNGWLRATPDGYCPRCNAKARHRRQCLYLRQNRDWLAAPVLLLDIAPWRALASWLRAQPGIRYLGVDLKPVGEWVTITGDAVALPLADASCDLAICIHVLEHVDDDRAAIGELFRVLRPGGRAVVSVPLQFEGPTREDPGVTDPEERRRLFGEPEHVRYYGLDLQQRLEEAGFSVSLDLAEDLRAEECARYGLRRDENIFSCIRPG